MSDHESRENQFASTVANLHRRETRFHALQVVQGAENHGIGDVGPPNDVGDEPTQAVWVGSLEYLVHEIGADTRYIADIQIMIPFLEYEIKLIVVSHMFVNSRAG